MMPVLEPDISLISSTSIDTDAEDEEAENGYNFNRTKIELSFAYMTIKSLADWLKQTMQPFFSDLP